MAWVCLYRNRKRDYASDKNIAKVLEKRKFDSCLNKRMIIVLSNTTRTDIEK